MERIITYNLSDNFITLLAEHIEKQYIQKGQDLGRIAIVFGGKRPALFLKKELVQRIKRSFSPPHFFSIDEFIAYSLSKKEPFTKVSDLDDCFTIYRLAQEMAPDILEGREAFSQFLPWAREILGFIEQLDFEDIQAASLKGIQDKASIGFDVPENINSLLESIIVLREAYHEAMAKTGTYSRGLMYLRACRQVPDCDFSEFDAIFFCGFFYLHKTEENIIKFLYDTRKAILFFQGDALEWSVLEKVSRQFSASITASGPTPQPQYQLSVQAGFDMHSEVCLVRETVKRIKEKERAVIVLPEPAHVIPLLSEISEFTDDFNVSMGYPLKRSSLYSLFECVYKAQETKKDATYYAKDYLKVLTHPLVKNLRLFPNPAVTRVLIHKIEEILIGIEESPLGGSLFVALTEIEHSRDLYDSALKTVKRMEIEVSRQELKDAVVEMHKFFFTSWETIASFYDFARCLERFLDLLVERSLLGSYPLNLKMAEKVFAIREELLRASFNREPFPQDEIFKVFKNKLESEKVAFSGSPLKGLQILGLFETRSLSFDTVIVMDVNESSLPNLKIYEPLIPREVMISLGLNRLEKEEEIQRYQFKRLIASAKHVFLIYQHRDDKEKSRFIEELTWEKQKTTDALDVICVPHASFSVKVLPKRLEIQKRSAVLQALRKLEFSATSVNTYMRCPLRFYYQYVLGLQEKEDLLEEPEAVHVGTFIHELLEETFSRFIGRSPVFTKEFKDIFLKALEEKFSQEFERRMKSDSFLLKEILVFRLKRFLENEKKRDIREVLCLEKTYLSKIQLDDEYISFQARIDRVDRLTDGSIIVLDYKTGAAGALPETNIEKIVAACTGRTGLKDTIKSFQLPLYLYFVGSDVTYAGCDINAALYSIKDSDDTHGVHTLFKKEISPGEKTKIMGAYMKALGCIIKDILDPGIPFVADEENVHHCALCPFFYLCR